jgi:hypothetical protein
MIGNPQAVAASGSGRNEGMRGLQAGNKSEPFTVYPVNDFSVSSA